LGYNGLDFTTGGALSDIRDRNFEDWQVGLALSFPLTLTGPRNSHKVAKAQRAQWVLEYKRQEEFVVQEVDTGVRSIRTLWNRIPFSREVVVAQEAALDAERRKLEAGKSTSFQVLSVASQLTTAQVDEISNILEYNKALAELAFRKGTTLERWNIDKPTRPNR
jgi:outer membrane protein TolC